jgi:glutathione S-transferase
MTGEDSRSRHETGGNDMAKVILHGPDYSTHVRTVRLCLAEKGVDYELEPVDLFRGANRKPDYLRLHPFGRVPVLEHDGFTLYETSAITRYVDEAFKGPKLQPSDKKDMARMSQIVSIIAAYGHEPIVTNIALPRAQQVFLKRPIDPAQIRKALPRARHCLSVIQDLMGDGPFLVGKSPTLADLHLAPVIAFFALTPEGKRMLPNLAGLSAWWERMAQRPSVIETRPAAVG